MERLKHIKYPPLKDKFKKYGDSFELVSKNESNRMYCKKLPHTLLGEMLKR